MDVKITNNADKFRDALPKQIEQALIAIGMTAESHAKRKCPVDTGRLRNSITYLVSGQGPKTVEYTARERYITKTGKKSKGRKTVNYNYQTGDASGDTSNSVYIGTNVEYAAAIELGTSKMAARPFLKPAATEHSKEYKKLVEMALKGE
jgi:HK97 gp10 family phage protein